MSHSAKHEKATHHYNLGVSYEREGDIEAARKEYMNALRDDPDFPYPYKSLGDIYYKEDNYEEALRNFNKALALDPDWVIVRGLLADVLLDLGKYSLAITHMEAALKEDPTNLHYATQLGRMYIADERYDDAIEILEEAEARDSANFVIQYSLGLAFGKRAMIDVEESIRHWEIAYKLDPKDKKIHRNMGIGYYTRGMLKEATECFRRALEADPDDNVSRKFIKFTQNIEKADCFE